MLVPWYLAVVAFAVVAITAGRVVAGPRRNQSGSNGLRHSNKFAATSLIVFFTLWSLAGLGIGIRRVYVFDSEPRLMYAIASPKVDLGNGRNELADRNAIVNLSSDYLTLENVTYGHISPEESHFVAPKSLASLPNFNIHYFPDDRPADEVRTRATSSGISRWWLRRSTSHEIELVSGKPTKTNSQTSVSEATQPMPILTNQTRPQSAADPRQRVDTSPSSRTSLDIGLNSTTSSPPRNHGFRFGQGKRAFEQNSSANSKNPRSQAPGFKSPGTPNATRGPFGSDPAMNRFDPYPSQLSEAQLQAIQDQVDRDMNRIIHAERVRDGFGF